LEPPVIVGITGADGFLGWHVKCHLFAHGIAFVTANRETFASPEALAHFAEHADVVFHVAGVNRADTDQAVVDGNLQLADALIDACKNASTPPGVVYANSTKALTGGFYGDAKAEAATRLTAYAESTGTFAADILFPHLFGEFGVPNYNSAVTTFAYQLAHGETSDVNDGQLELLHAQDAAKLMLQAAKDAATVRLQPNGTAISVPDCHARMQRLATYVEAGIVPDMNGNHLDLELFNAIRSQMWPDAYPMALTRHEDHRGAFFEVVRAWGQGQTSISTTAPGIVRGEHFHFEKVERFAVISGQATIRVRRLFTDQVHSFDVTGTEPVFIDMPPLCTHDITNTGDQELITLFWSHDHFDPAAGDTYPAPVVGSELIA
jgi:UDP-2-acetamido-2,6-beta-L-arabino-hexul-4-ose reductase